jgi:uncharacterized membrane protein YccC
LQYYFVAQDIHERASSSHIQYQTLRDQFRYSDVMFRFQRMLSMQAQACQKLSRAILLREPYQHDAHFERAFMHLDAALERVRASGASDEQIKALGFYSITCAPSMRSWPPLNRCKPPPLLTVIPRHCWPMIGSAVERYLAAPAAQYVARVGPFRHAVRMSLVLCAGYAFIQFTGSSMATGSC